VRWEHLEVPVERRKRRIFKGYGLMFIVMPIACVMLMVSTYFAVILKATPPFINCPPRDDGLPCELTVPIVLTNIGNWLWTTVMLISAYQLIIQPVLWLSTDGGPCGAGFAEATTSYTESCLHLMLRVCAFQILGTILTACFFIPIASSEHYFMGAPAGWIPPEERLAAALNASAAALNASAAALNASTAVLNGAAGSALTTLTGAFSLRIYCRRGHQLHHRRLDRDQPRHRRPGEARLPGAAADGAVPAHASGHAIFMVQGSVHSAKRLFCLCLKLHSSIVGQRR
jgi:hypothetical protein